MFALDSIVFSGQNVGWWQDLWYIFASLYFAGFIPLTSLNPVLSS